MKVSLGLMWVGAALNVYAATQEASLYIQDNSLSPASSKPQSISPKTARLLLAQRLGLSQYHDLGAADEGTLDVLNTYGGPQQLAFEDEEPSRQQRTDKLLFIIEGVEYAEGIFLRARALKAMLNELSRCDRLRRETNPHDCRSTRQQTQCETCPRSARAIAARRLW